MIQRIQTLFLLFSTILLSVLFFSPLAEFSISSGDVIRLHHDSMYIVENGEDIYSTVPILFLLIIILTINIVTIFMYKNRKRQIRLCVYNIVLMFGLVGIIYFFYKVGIKEVIETRNITPVSQKMNIASMVPLIAAFFNYLACRNIIKDEALVRSMDRLR